MHLFQFSIGRHTEQWLAEENGLLIVAATFTGSGFVSLVGCIIEFGLDTSNFKVAFQRREKGCATVCKLSGTPTDPFDLRLCPRRVLLAGFRITVRSNKV